MGGMVTAVPRPDRPSGPHLRSASSR